MRMILFHHIDCTIVTPSSGFSALKEGEPEQPKSRPCLVGVGRDASRRSVGGIARQVGSGEPGGGFGVQRSLASTFFGLNNSSSSRPYPLMSIEGEVEHWLRMHQTVLRKAQNGECYSSCAFCHHPGVQSHVCPSSNLKVLQIMGQAISKRRREFWWATHEADPPAQPPKHEGLG